MATDLNQISFNHFLSHIILLKTFDRSDESSGGGFHAPDMIAMQARKTPINSFWFLASSERRRRQKVDASTNWKRRPNVVNLSDASHATQPQNSDLIIQKRSC